MILCREYRWLLGRFENSTEKTQISRHKLPSEPISTFVTFRNAIATLPSVDRFSFFHEKLLVLEHSRRAKSCRELLSTFSFSPLLADSLAFFTRECSRVREHILQQAVFIIQQQIKRHRKCALVCL